MGTPRKQRRKYSRPAHPWKLERITEEKELCLKYGLKNKKSIWKIRSMLARIRDQAKLLLAASGEKAEKDKLELISKLNVWGIAAKSIDDILALDATALLDRRLQSIVVKRGLAKTPKEARQFIVHRHIWVGAHKITIPSYIVLASEEETVRLADEIAKVKEGAGKEVKEAG